MNSLLTELSISQWCELLIPILWVTAPERQATFSFWIWNGEDFPPSSLPLHCYIGGSYCSGLPQVLQRHTSEPWAHSCSPPYCCFYRISHIPNTCHDSAPSPNPLKFNPNYWIKVQRNIERWVPCKILLCEYKLRSTENSFHTVSLLVHYAKPTEFLPALHIYQKVLASKHLKSHVIVKQTDFLLLKTYFIQE